MTSRLLCRDYWITISGFLGRKMLIFNTPKSCFFDNFADKIPKKNSLYIYSKVWRDNTKTETSSIV